MTHAQLKEALENFKEDSNNWYELCFHVYESKSFPEVVILYSQYWGLFFAEYRNGEEYKTYPDFERSMSGLPSCDCCLE